MGTVKMWCDKSKEYNNLAQDILPLLFQNNLLFFTEALTKLTTYNEILHMRGWSVIDIWIYIVLTGFNTNTSLLPWDAQSQRVESE